MFRTASHLISFSSRYSARVNLNAVTRTPRAAFTQRMLSSESRASHGSTSSDRPWVIGSALVFGSLFLYLVSPSARKSSHGHTDHGHDSHRLEHDNTRAQHVEPDRPENVKPIVDDEGTEISSQEVKESVERAFNADSPKDAQEREEVVAKAEENSAIEAPPQAESSTDATPTPESEPSSAPVVTVGVDEATSATSDQKVQSTASNTEVVAMDSKA